ncbi:GILT-like protein 1 [Acyrthosiphon pisum]|uniref:Gamma-interferon-inducible lysosomal thiol reductase n=1 Tax=Acyrthosiphon pisum TaxID=7029 RepID=A0A8R2NNQ1_ACYPI|nr:GILT-like protein 1 [Acyrthosiphon pisum]|eukprot:XP_008186717.1 PREDICTED: gamma-interferon-inducible lysosomal thiol reductase [Acyrthosiphon pisum]
MYLTNMRLLKVFSSYKFRFCIAFIVVLSFWQIFRAITNSNKQKLIHSSRDLNHDTSLVAKSVKDMKYLPVGVYYEALCPDSRNFILQHLVPSFNKAPNSFDIEFVPYGKAKTHENADGSIIFACQHGPVECHANKIHSCATQHIKDKEVLVKYVSCMIDNNYDPEMIGMLCAKKYNVNWNKIYTCSEGKEGELLLKLNGEATDKLWPQVSFIPTILINHEQPRQASVLKDFWGVACSYFPPESKPAAC